MPTRDKIFHIGQTISLNVNSTFLKIWTAAWLSFSRIDPLFSTAKIWVLKKQSYQ